jgi:hypothetical protein
VASAFEQIPPFPPLQRGAEGGFCPAGDLGERHSGSFKSILWMFESIGKNACE